MRAAIVGCGGIAQVHAKCLKEIKGIELVAAADICSEKAAAFSKQYGITAYSDFTDMMDKEKIDVLHICTPHYLHTPMAVTALERGVNVFMEKPPVINSRQFEELKTAVDTEGTAKLGICFQNRFNPESIRMKELITQKKFGRLLGIRGIVSWSRTPEYYEDSNWRGDIDREGGGALINQSIHTLDLIQYITGESPLSVDAVMANHHLKSYIDEEDMVSAFITYPGSIATLHCTTAYCRNLPVLIEAECERGRIRIEGNRISIINRQDTASEEFPNQEYVGKDYWGAGHLECIRSFYEDILNGTGGTIELCDVEDTINLLLGIYRSARNRCTEVFDRNPFDNSYIQITNC